MDTLSTVSDRRRTTRAAEGLDRWRWTTAELVTLRRMGMFADEDRFELFDGEMVPTGKESRRHAIIADRIIQAWRLRDLVGLRVGENKQFNLDDATYTKPDILVWAKGQEIPDVRGPDVLVLVEVADSSLDKDLITKRDLYARFGVREYWVIDAEALTVRVHKRLTDGAYGDIRTHTATETIIPGLAPALALRLADFAAGL
jgi:Uma2 family endonuclease